MNAKKVTIYDIAQAAGVSVGTVNRALSGKDRISPVTKQLVLDTADWAETLCGEYICSRDQKTGIEDYGYGKIGRAHV